MENFKRELIVGVISGFLTGLIFLIGDILRESRSDWIVVAVLALLFIGTLFYIMRMKK